MKKKSKGIGKSIISAEVPNIVMFVKMMAMMDQPIGYEIWNKAITEYPEHFPEEVEHRRKWALIPQEVHDAYHKESPQWKLEKDEEILAKIGSPPYPELEGNGIIWYVTNCHLYPEELAANDKWRDEYYKLSSEKEKVVYEKHYGKYGLTKED